MHVKRRHEYAFSNVFDSIRPVSTRVESKPTPICSHKNCVEIDNPTKLQKLHNFLEKGRRAQMHVNCMHEYTFSTVFDSLRPVSTRVESKPTPICSHKNCVEIDNRTKLNKRRILLEKPRRAQMRVKNWHEYTFSTHFRPTPFRLLKF